MGDDGVHGPIDFLLIEFPDDRPRGEAAEALLDLVDRGIVRLYDILAIEKDRDGVARELRVEDLGSNSAFSTLAGARSGILSDEDVGEAANALEPGTMAALVVYENTWAVPFVAAARRAGGQVVASARIPAQDLMDVLDVLEAFEKAS